MSFKCSHCGKPTDNVKSYEGIIIHTCDECEEQISKEVEWEYKNNHYREKTIICPYCDYEYEAYEAYVYEEAEEEIECELCGRKFDLEVEDVRYFSTKRSVCEMPDEKGQKSEKIYD